MDDATVKVLLLDDDEDEYVILRRLVSGMHRRCSVDWTADPESALADMRRADHDVYLVDYRLGAVTGVDVIRAAVAAGVQAPLIVLTGTSVAEADVDIVALRSGAADYLSKDGLTADILERAIRYARERAESARLRESLGRAYEESARLSEALALVESQARKLRVLSESERRGREQASFLAEASAVLTSSLDIETVLQSLANLAVPRFADWCSVQILDGEAMKLVAVAHADTEKARWARELQTKYPSRQDKPDIAREVIRTGRPALLRDVDGSLLQAAARDEAHLAALRELGIKSALVVPLMTAGRALGALTLVAAESHAAYDESDVEFMTEVAHRAALAVENARLYQDAKRAIELREEFLAIAGHELRTPVTSLLLEIQILERSVRTEKVDQKVTERLARAAAAGARLDRLVNQLLDVSRISAGRLRLERERIRLDELVREVVERFSTISIRAQTPLRVHVEPDIIGSWDRERLEQVVTNLVSNAMKYGTGKPVDVELDRIDGHAVLRVTDRGIGIPPEHQRRIFERFERAVGTREYGGFGLGLWIVREIVDGSGGHIEVASEPGQGATFTVTLPLQVADNAQGRPG